MNWVVTCLNNIKWKSLSLFLRLYDSLQSKAQYIVLIGHLKHPRASAEGKAHVCIVWHRQSLVKRFYSLKRWTNEEQGQHCLPFSAHKDEGREKSMVHSKFAFCLKPTPHRERNRKDPEFLLKTFAIKLFSYLKTLLLQKIINCFSGGLTANILEAWKSNSCICEDLHILGGSEVSGTSQASHFLRMFWLPASIIPANWFKELI